MRGDRKKMIVSVVAGVVGLVVSWAYLSAREHSILERGDEVAVLVAADDIQPGVQLNAWLVERRRVPRAYRQPEALEMIGDAARFVAAAPILKGEQIMTTKLSVAGTDGGVSGMVPIGMRAVSLTAGGETKMIKAGDFVDLIATFDLSAEGGIKKYTYTILQNVSVIFAGTEEKSGPGSAAPPDKQGALKFTAAAPFQKQRGEENITVALKPEDVQKVVFAQDAGRIAVSLRNPVDDGILKVMEPATAYSLTHLDLLLPQKNAQFREYRGR